MARMRRSRQLKVDTPDLTPMIDCVFLLLIFFMVATSFVQESKLFEIELPKAQETSVETDATVLTILVSQKGTFALSPGFEPVDKRRLFAEVTRHQKEGKIESVIINADKSTNYQNVVTVIDIVRTAGFTGFSLSVLQH